MQVLTDPQARSTRPTRPAAITVDDLMTHRSGLAYAFSVPGPIGRAYGRLSFRQDPDRWLAEAGQAAAGLSAGRALPYSHATDVLGIVLSRIEGKPLSEVLAERIFAPLGMVDTDFWVGAEDAAVPRRCTNSMTTAYG